MPKRLKRYYGWGDMHFLTFSCYRRLPLLDTVRARHVFVKALGKIHKRYKFMADGTEAVFFLDADVRREDTTF